jgi:hypothetical protein
MALVGALGLLVLAAGLLAGTAVASIGLQRATTTLATTARADSELRRGLAGVLQRWDAGLDSMPVGSAVDRATPTVVVDGARVAVRTRIRRLGPTLYAATATVVLGDSTAPLASRRARLLVGRLVDTSTSVGSAGVRPVSRWSVTELP